MCGEEEEEERSNIRGRRRFRERTEKEDTYREKQCGINITCQTRRSPLCLLSLASFVAIVIV